MSAVSSSSYATVSSINSTKSRSSSYSSSNVPIASANSADATASLCTLFPSILSALISSPPDKL
ncbi:hypothetical protein [Clostridioides difficile]|uniref:hypothetical protein n=1 Tax=Clostridioides difficile TaxID=1496 RepID=UPI0018DE6E1F|nr:hypothetical protein [Clostridioides difficile]MBH9841347.1 hypothetical protein [Clostridioides difficile]